MSFWDDVAQVAVPVSYISDDVEDIITSNEGGNGTEDSSGGNETNNSAESSPSEVKMGYIKPWWVGARQAKKVAQMIQPDSYTPETITVTPEYNAIMQALTQGVTDPNSPIGLALSGAPNPYFQTGVIDPMTKQFEQYTLPTVKGQYTDNGLFYSGAGRNAVQSATENQAAQLANVRYTDFVNAQQRAMQAASAAGVAANVAQYPSQVQQQNVANQTQAWAQKENLDLQAVNSALNYLGLWSNNAIGGYNATTGRYNAQTGAYSAETGRIATENQAALTQAQIDNYAWQQAMYEQQMQNSQNSSLYSALGSIAGAGLGSLAGPAGMMVGSTAGGALGSYLGGGTPSTGTVPSIVNSVAMPYVYFNPNTMWGWGGNSGTNSGYSTSTAW